jgi:multiple sugar transport system permease protein
MKGSRHTWAGLAWISPWIVGGIAFMFLPMGLSLYYSFTDYSLLEPPLWAGWGNYKRLLSDPRFLLAVRNTLWYSGLFIPLATALSLALAALLTGKIRLRFSRFVQACIFVPTLVPLVASAMVWMWLFNAEYGLVNKALAAVHLKGPNWLGATSWAVPALVVMSLWSIGQQVVVYIAAMNEVPAELHEAARIDGMGRLGRFFRVTLPLISPVVLFNVVVLTINTLQVFAQPYIMFRTKDGQNEGGMFYSMYLYDNAFVYRQMGYASAMAWVQLLVVLGLTGAMFWVSRRFVHYRAA